MNRTKAVIGGIGLFLGLALGMPIGAAISHADPAAPSQPAEDEPGFDCRVHGNRICGPGNAQGVAPGDYSAIGIIRAAVTGAPSPVEASTATSWEELLLPAT